VLAQWTGIGDVAPLKYAADAEAVEFCHQCIIFTEIIATGLKKALEDESVLGGESQI
jgi:hypothetical protein